MLPGLICAMAILSLRQNTSEKLFLAGLREIRVIIAWNSCRGINCVIISERRVNREMLPILFQTMGCNVIFTHIHFFVVPNRNKGKCCPFSQKFGNVMWFSFFMHVFCLEQGECCFFSKHFCVCFGSIKHFWVCTWTLQTCYSKQEKMLTIFLKQLGGIFQSFFKMWGHVAWDAFWVFKVFAQDRRKCCAFFLKKSGWETWVL